MDMADIASSSPIMAWRVFAFGAPALLAVSVGGVIKCYVGRSTFFIVPLQGFPLFWR